MEGLEGAEVGQEPGFGTVVCVVAPGDGAYGVVRDDSGEGFLAFVFCFGHGDVFFVFDQLGQCERRNIGGYLR